MFKLLYTHVVHGHILRAQISLIPDWNQLFFKAVDSIFLIFYNSCHFLDFIFSLSTCKFFILDRFLSILKQLYQLLFPYPCTFKLSILFYQLFLTFQCDCLFPLIPDCQLSFQLFFDLNDICQVFL